MEKKNNLGLYASRALRHFVKLLVLVALLFGAMIATNTLAVAPEQLLGTRGAVLLVAMVVLSLAYPSYGYSSVRVQASMEHDRGAIVEALLRGDYTLHSEAEGVMVFRSSSAWKRVVNVGDEAITIHTEGSGIVVSGVRKEVENARFRIAGLLNNR